MARSLRYRIDSHVYSFIRHSLQVQARCPLYRCTINMVYSRWCLSVEAPRSPTLFFTSSHHVPQQTPPCQHWLHRLLGSYLPSCTGFPEKSDSGDTAALLGQGQGGVAILIGERHFGP